jgi:hypothetical protein
MFKLPYLLGPLTAPTAASDTPGGWAHYATQWTRSYPLELWYRYMSESGN